MDNSTLLNHILAAGPLGCNIDDLENAFPDVSRSTLNRRLADLTSNNEIHRYGSGRLTRYRSLSGFTLQQLRDYLAMDWQQRAPAPFDETRLAATPLIDADKARRLACLCGRAGQLDRKFLQQFLIDFSWGSSILEGGTYTDLDTQALVEYGEKNPDKPLEDALLILNHKVAIEYLWEHRSLDSETLCAIHARLLDRHNLADIEESDHFLPPELCGVPREYVDVNIHRTAYMPPFRPGEQYIAAAFEQIIETARSLPAVSAAFYLLTRIPYVQVFANGNKRTSRLAANIPLLAHDLLPISFVDFNKADYLRAMLAFYELGDVQLMELMFIQGYVRSIIRGSTLSPLERVSLLHDGQQKLVAELEHYVQTGSRPASRLGLSFLASPRGH